MPHTGAWCDDCRSVAVAEEVPDPATLADRGERRLCWMRNRGYGPGDEWFDRRQRQFADQRAWRAWRAVRVGPPRCLVYRSAAVALFDLAIDPLGERVRPAVVEFPHPGCGGRLQLESAWHHHARSAWVYAVEGDFLGFANGSRPFEPPGEPLPPSAAGWRQLADLSASGT